jgi:cardiolipin synthase
MTLENNVAQTNKITLIKSGHEFFDLLNKLIADANKSICIHTYILGDDETGRLIIDNLILAKKRNVDISILVDGMAQPISNKLKNKIVAANISFKAFEPFFKCSHFYIGRRLHQKIVVIDNIYSLIGGMNLANRYNDFPNEKAWLDFAVLINGEASNIIGSYCQNFQHTISKKEATNHSTSKQPIPSTQHQTEFDVRIRQNDWVKHKNEITNSYIELLHTAKKEIIIVCSYFIPGKVLRRLIANATRRGVIIKILIAGPSDVMIAKKAERWLYDWLLRNKIEIYEYRKNILHAKLAICDEEWITIGSYNLNNISAYASVEFNIDIRQYSFVKKVKTTISEIIANDCIRITKEYHNKNTNIIKQFSHWVSYQSIRLLLILFTFYFKREN